MSKSYENIAMPQIIPRPVSGMDDAKNLSTTEKATHAVLLLQSGSLVSEDELLL